jgi:hypothetical protein
LLLTGLSITFLKEFGLGLWLSLPLSLSLATTGAVLGLGVDRKEGWSRFDSVYWWFITATTVGFGDLRPGKSASKIIAVVMALLGANIDRHLDCGRCARRHVGTRLARCCRESQVRDYCPPVRRLHPLGPATAGGRSSKKVSGGASVVAPFERNQP